MGYDKSSTIQINAKMFQDFSLRLVLLWNIGYVYVSEKC